MSCIDYFFRLNEAEPHQPPLTGHQEDEDIPWQTGTDINRNQQEVTIHSFTLMIGACPIWCFIITVDGTQNISPLSADSCLSHLISPSCSLPAHGLILPGLTGQKKQWQQVIHCLLRIGFDEGHVPGCGFAVVTAKKRGMNGDKQLLQDRPRGKRSRCASKSNFEE